MTDSNVLNIIFRSLIKVDSMSRMSENANPVRIDGDLLNLFDEKIRVWVRLWNLSLKTEIL